MINANWTKYFIPPFHNDAICVDTIWDSVDNRTTSSNSDAAFKGTADAHFQAIVAAMNAKVNGTAKPDMMSFGCPVYEGTQSDAVVKFKADGQEIELDVRGWGFLTSIANLREQVLHNSIVTEARQVLYKEFLNPFDVPDEVACVIERKCFFCVHQ